MQVRIVRLLGLDDPIEQDDEDRKRIRLAEAVARYRVRHPKRITAQNKAQYRKNRAKRLANERARMQGPRRALLLEKHRQANARYYAKRGVVKKRAKFGIYERHANNLAHLVNIRAARKAAGILP